MTYLLPNEFCGLDWRARFGISMAAGALAEQLLLPGTLANALKPTRLWPLLEQSHVVTAVLASPVMLSGIAADIGCRPLEDTKDDFVRYARPAVAGLIGAYVVKGIMAKTT